MNRTKNIKGFVTYDTILASLVILLVMFEVVFVTSTMIKRKNNYISKQSIINKLIIIGDNIVKHGCQSTGNTDNDVCKPNIIYSIPDERITQLKSTFELNDLYVGFDKDYGPNHPDETCIYRIVIHNNNPALLYVCGN